MNTPLNPELLVPTGRALLLGSFGWTLLQAVRGKNDLALPFERVVIGMICLSSFQMAALYLESASDQLSSLISSAHERDDLRSLLLEAFKAAANAPSASGTPTNGFNLPEVMEQAWRTGVWGVMSALVEGVFVIASFILECAQEVLWQLLLFLFPMSAGVFPLFPRMMGNLVLYAVELSLWFPMLLLIELVTGIVAKGHLKQSGSLGLYIVGVEVVAILLILMIPSIAHRFLSGAFSGDFNSHASILLWSRRVIQVSRHQLRGGGA